MNKLKRHERIRLQHQGLEDQMRIQLNGKKFIEFSRQDVNDYTNDYLIRDNHERCDDPLVQDKFKALYERLEVEEEDKITHFTTLF